MPAVTLQVLEGIDKGRLFRELPTPVTIGREEGNALRLNDERVSRFHAKIQFDNGEVIITDLDSTNGTRVNGNVVQIRRLRAGDKIHVGRSVLLFGSESEIRARAETLQSSGAASPGGATRYGPATVQQSQAQQPLLPSSIVDDLDVDLNLTEPITTQGGTLYQGARALPPLPQKMSPSQAARLSELLEFLHRHLTTATENIRTNDDASQITLAFNDWQKVLAVQMLLARYVRAVSEPDALEE